MDLGLKGQTVLVTGSSSGVGKAAAIAFGAEGARVAVTRTVRALTRRRTRSTRPEGRPWSCPTTWPTRR